MLKLCHTLFWFPNVFREALKNRLINKKGKASRIQGFQLYYKSLTI